MLCPINHETFLSTASTASCGIERIFVFAQTFDHQLSDILFTVLWFAYFSVCCLLGK